MMDSTTLKRIALALALLAAFVGGIATERACAADDAACYRERCEALSEALESYAHLD